MAWRLEDDSGASKLRDVAIYAPLGTVARKNNKPIVELASDGVALGTALGAAKPFAATG